MLSRQELPTKLLGSITAAKFDFTSDLAAGETIVTQVVTASVYSGTDAIPGNVISGGATAVGSIVTQLIKAGIVGTMYELLCAVTTSAGQTLQKVGLLAVVPDL